MNKRYCKILTLLGENGDAVYDTLAEKKEEIWRRMHSDPTPSEMLVESDLVLEFRAMALFGKDVKGLLLDRALLSNDISLLRFVQAL